MRDEPKTVGAVASKSSTKKSNQPASAPVERASMDFSYREPSIAPCLILDVDNGVDFTFKGMKLKGNR